MRSIRPSMLALLSGASLLGSTSAPASLMPFSVSATNTASPGLQTLSFLQFDSALGTLTGVTFTLNSQSVGLASTVTNNYSNNEGGAASALTSAVFDIDGPGGVDLFQGNGSATSSCSNGGPNPSCSGTTGGTTPPVFSPLIVPFTNPPTSLSPYIGNGASFFDVFVELDVSTIVQSCQAFVSGTPICSSTGSASWNGTVDVTYTYTPPATSVPEPATVALLGLGLAGLGFSRRKA